jgi:peptidoglycan/LPS O-acetylase OafA/YrhL
VTDRHHAAFIPALDGLRGIAIILVMLHHFTYYRPETGIDAVIAGVPLFGWVGVDLFFVLSGFLITGILLDSRGSTRYFTNFYARRTLRIFPLYYLVLFLALVALPQFPSVHTVLAGDIEMPPRWPYWAYLTNFSVAERGFVHGWVDVAWSLAIEEQFYLVWPLVIWLCPQRLLPWLCTAIVIGEVFARSYCDCERATVAANQRGDDDN